MAHCLVSNTYQKGSGKQNRHCFLSHAVSLLLLLIVYRINLIDTIRIPYSILTLLSWFFLTFTKEALPCVAAFCCLEAETAYKHRVQDRFMHTVVPLNHNIHIRYLFQTV